MLITIDEGKPTLLAWLMCEDTRTDFSLRLFSNDIAVTQETKLADLTQASFSGYSAKTLARTSFATPTINSSAAMTSYASQTWTNSSGSSTTVCGVYVTNSAGTILFWVEKFNPVANIAASGSLTYTPTFWFGGCL